MTRENKLALVVGFGLILFVGILISDHFSTVRRQQAAHLRRDVVDPLMRSNPTADPPQELVDLLFLRLLQLAGIVLVGWIVAALIVRWIGARIAPRA